VGRRGDAVRGNVGRSLRGIDNPAPRGSQRVKKARKVTNLKEVAPVSRENGCVQHVSCPEAPAARSACGRVEEAREGFGCVIIGTHPAGWARNLGGAESQGGIRCGVWLNPKHGARDPRDEQSPEAAMRRSRRIQSREGHGVRKGVRRSGGSKASKGEPHERDQDEISLAGREGSKASKG
jgi:hypothetical protein